MANLINKYIANKPLNNPSMQSKPAYTIDTAGKIKPLEDKAQLLPSRIFGSPIEYAKDLKQDVLNIKKAAKGKANDHELGRINDLGMKLGATALAGYLFVKNPFKLGKAMEFIGAGTFFASMALWPKLAIQLPLKLRTGVDIHQKYIDSQGRKKMLHQDPQYDLTDLYSQQDLEKMGKKLKVDENLPDRNRFIKQRAKKTAIQGNTLWMMTAGLATPLGSALLSNRLEKPVSNGIEKGNLFLTKKLFENLEFTQKIADVTKKSDSAFISKFCKQQAGKGLTDDALDTLATHLTKGFGSQVKDAFKAEILKASEGIIGKSATADHAKQLLEKCGFAKEMVEELMNEEIFIDAIKTNKTENIIDIVREFGDENKVVGALQDVRASLIDMSKLEGTIKNISEVLSPARAKSKVINKFISARVGKEQNSYGANQWGRTVETFFKKLKLSDDELKIIAKGGEKGKALSNDDVYKLIESKLKALAKNDEEFAAFKSEFFKLVDEFDEKTGASFLDKISSKTKTLHATVSESLEAKGFKILSRTMNPKMANTPFQEVIRDAFSNGLGEKATFYRMFQAVDIHNGTNLTDKLFDSDFVKHEAKAFLDSISSFEFDSTTKKLITDAKNNGFKLTTKDFEAIKKAIKAMTDGSEKETAGKALDAFSGKFDSLVKKCGKVSYEATATEFFEKLNTPGFESSKEEFKAIIKALFDKTDAPSSTINKGFREYCDDFISQVANKGQARGNVLQRFNEYVLGAEKVISDRTTNDMVGDRLENVMKKTAQNMLNSKKWLKISGISFAVLTVGTVLATLALGKKGKTEKQVEESNKVNG